MNDGGSGHRGVSRSAITVALASMAIVSGCSGSDSSSAESAVESAVATTVSTDDLFVDSGEMRPVPTVPASTVLGQTGVGDDGVIEVSPTLAAPQAPGGDSVPPPSTDLVGDPQPVPGAASTVAPPPLVPIADACIRLSEVGVPDLIAAESGVSPTVEAIDDTSCRFEFDGRLVEVYMVPAAQIDDDWAFRRGVEPVGEVSRSVGFSSFITPDGDGGGGYTIALAAGLEGAVVAVMGSLDARGLAIDVALTTQQALE